MGSSGPRGFLLITGSLLGTEILSEIPRSPWCPTNCSHAARTIWTWKVSSGTYIPYITLTQLLPLILEAECAWHPAHHWEPREDGIHVITGVLSGPLPKGLYGHSGRGFLGVSTVDAVGGVIWFYSGKYPNLVSVTVWTIFFCYLNVPMRTSRGNLDSIAPFWSYAGRIRHLKPGSYLGEPQLTALSYLMSFSVCTDSSNIPYHFKELVKGLFAAGELSDLSFLWEACRGKGQGSLRSSEWGDWAVMGTQLSFLKVQRDLEREGARITGSSP